MLGFQLTFFTQQDRRHCGMPLGQWLLEEAHDIGIRGATLMTAAEGFGHERKIRSARFFELTDQPIEVTMAVSEAEAGPIVRQTEGREESTFSMSRPPSNSA